MFNSYSLAFGPVPKSKDLKRFVELDNYICNIVIGRLGHGRLDYDLPEEELEAVLKHNFTDADKLKEYGLELPLTEPEKAYILDAVYNYANENFYDLEDEGEIDSAEELQDKVIDALVKALK